MFGSASSAIVALKSASNSKPWLPIGKFCSPDLLSLNEQEWNLLSTYLETQDYAERSVRSWQAAARIYFDLRRQGLTVRSPIDCCIAQAALENDLLLVHNDRDFETIAQVRSLQHLRFQP
jgi:predicted nucleic acid-binding protein